MRLDALLERGDVPSIEIRGITADSRTVETGDMFVAVQGNAFDGHAFVEQAIERGAACVLAERSIEAFGDCVMVADAALVAKRNEIAARLFDYPSKHMECIGVTGTNGKTSVAYGLANLMDDTGFMGSLGWGFPPEMEPTELTTMDGVALQVRLAQLRQRGASKVTMEASSHALAQRRLSDVELSVGVFTNLSRDHLDFHGSMKNYANAKRRLFEDFELERAIVNADDRLGQRLASSCRTRDIPTTTYGVDRDADIAYEIDSITIDGVRGTWRTKWGDAAMRMPVPSEFSVANGAAMLATLLHFGYDLEYATGKLKSLPPVPGRLEFVATSAEVKVVVDYAHTPDALTKSLHALRRLKPTELVCVFGCGGDRDKGKRPLMGEAAETAADRVFVTNDNPRTESPDAIAAAIVAGMSRPHDASIVLDRERAIAHAIDIALPGGIVLIAGKGAETYQDVGGVRHPFSDRDVAKKVIQGDSSVTLAH